jgi:hypothetical protein
MSSVMVYRASGLALLCGALLVVIGCVLRLPVPLVPTPTQEASALYVAANVVIFSGLALLLFGWLGIVARLALLTGWLGLAGALLLFLSGVVFASIPAYNVLASPWYAVHAPHAAAQVALGTPAVVVAAFVAGLLVLGGAALAEIALVRARLLAARAGMLMCVGAVLGLVFDLVIHSSIASLVATVALLLVLVGLGWMAYTLLIADGKAPGQPDLTP